MAYTQAIPAAVATVDRPGTPHLLRGWLDYVPEGELLLPWLKPTYANTAFALVFELLDELTAPTLWTREKPPASLRFRQL
jgi:hypothetical protein